MTAPISARIETERLILRRWRDEDAEPYAEICADPEVMRWIGNGTTRTAEESAAAIERFEQTWERRGFGPFAVELRRTGRLIGFNGFLSPDFLPEILPAVEIGWRLARDAWGQGLATEGAQAALRFGFDDLGLQRVVSIYQVGNSASARVMEKLGMRLERETVDPETGRRVRVCDISKSAFSG
ncbi:MAG: GNAT family N-acetyltransferase [Pseudomonadota bacterium]